MVVVAQIAAARKLKHKDGGGQVCAHDEHPRPNLSDDYNVLNYSPLHGLLMKRYGLNSARMGPGRKAAIKALDGRESDERLPGKAMKSDDRESVYLKDHTNSLTAKMNEAWDSADVNKDGVIDGGEFTIALEKYLLELSGHACTTDNAILLCGFLDANLTGQVDKAQFPLAIRLWKLANDNRAKWVSVLQQQEEKEGDELSAMHELLKRINGEGFVDDSGMEPTRTCMGAGRVGFLEAEWVLELVRTICQDESNRDLVSVVAVSYWALTSSFEASSGLARGALLERLELETRFRTGCFRFIIFFLFFIFFTQAILHASKNANCRNIRSVLVAQYDLEAAAEVNSLNGIKEYMASFSGSTAGMTPISLDYFGAAREVKLLDTPTVFDEPMALPETELWFGSGFTLQAWVKVDSSIFLPPGGLPIVRRGLAAVGEGSELSCFSWNFPPSIHFGAHDYGGAGANSKTGLMEEYVEVAYPANVTAITTSDYPETSNMVMHTIVVSSTSATFYINAGELVDSVPINRPITDCSGAAFSVGARGLELATVMYFPKPVTPNEIGEIYRQGGLMSNMGYGIKLPSVEEHTRLDELNEAMVQSRIVDQEVRTSFSAQVVSSASISALAVTAPRTTAVAYSNSNHVVTQGPDPVLGYNVYTIWEAPKYVDSSSSILLAGDALPAITSTAGLAISMWAKFSQTGNGFLLARSVPKKDGASFSWTGNADICWRIYMGGDWTRLDFKNAAGDWVGHHLFDNQVPDEMNFRAKSYRHFVFQADPQNTTHPVMICVDGACDGALRGSTNVDKGPPTDCDVSKPNDPGGSYAESLGNATVWVGARPPGAWPFTGSLMNFKAFDRKLTEIEVGQLFRNDPDPLSTATPPETIKDLHGCKSPKELTDDPTFTDDFGNDCFWYFRSQQLGLQNCNRNVKAARACPVACGSAEVCWGPGATGSSATFQIWQQQMDFKTSGGWGTSCIGKSTTAAKEAIKCGKNAPGYQAACDALGIKNCSAVDCAAYENDEERLLDCLGDIAWTSSANWKPNEFLPCAQIIRTAQPACVWDDTGLENIAADIGSTNEWSLTFWVESMFTSDCLQPRLRLLDGDGLTFSWLDGFEGVTLDPPLGSGCPQSTWISHQQHANKQAGYPNMANTDIAVPSRPKPGQKQLFVLGKLASGKVALQYNTEGGSQYPNDASFGYPTAKTSKEFLRVINVLGDVRISPMQLSSKYPLQGSIAKLRYGELARQEKRRGASPSLNDQLTTTISRGTEIFKEKTTLVSPPLVIQTRKKFGSCYWDFSDTVVQSFYSTGKSRHCQAPYQCEDYSVKKVYQCPGEEDDAPFFGIQPVFFMGQMAYTEFLSTITDNPIVVRKENDAMVVKQTNSFLDMLTSSIKIAAIFYSPEYGITSKLVVEFDFTAAGIAAGYEIRHYVALTGSELRHFFILQYLVLACQVVLIVDSFFLFREMKAQREVAGSWNKGLLFLVVLDGLIQVTTLIFFALNQVGKGKSGPNTEEYIGDLVGLGWADQSQNFDLKKGSFLRVLNALSERMAESAMVEVFGMGIALIVFVRLVSATDAHPRIALITSVLKLAASDMVHFFLIFFMVLFGIAVIGSWRFGSERGEFRSILAAMRTQFDAVLGPPGEIPLATGEDTDFEYMFFVLFIHVINFFLLTNFFLAIIVNSYTMVMIKMEQSIVEQNVLADFYAMLKKFAARARYPSWPSQAKIRQGLKQMANACLTAEDLYPAIFPTEESAQTYIDYHLNNFAFLHSSAEQSGPADAQLHSAHRLNDVKLNALLSRLDPKMQARSQKLKLSAMEAANEPGPVIQGVLQQEDMERKFTEFKGVLQQARGERRSSALSHQSAEQLRQAGSEGLGECMRRLEDRLGTRDQQVAQLRQQLQVVSDQFSDLTASQAAAGIAGIAVEIDIAMQAVAAPAAVQTAAQPIRKELPQISSASYSSAQPIRKELSQISSASYSSAQPRHHSPSHRTPSESDNERLQEFPRSMSPGGGDSTAKISMPGRRTPKLRGRRSPESRSRHFE